MANNFDSNITQKLIRVFLEKFESARVLSKNVNIQLLEGQFDPASGDEVNFKRPTDYVSVRTPDGDLSATSPLQSSIITGKAKGLVQPYFTVNVDFKQVDQALKMDQLDELLAPMATRIVTDLEVDFAAFMMKNSGLRAGVPGNAVSDWTEVANAGALMQSSGIPMDGGWKYAVNPFTQVTLANIQRSLGAGGSAGALISEAQKQAIIAQDFAGMMVMNATTLASFTAATTGDRIGALSATPDSTYVTAKDTMTQALVVDSFTNTFTVFAGETLTIAGVNRLNLSTRKVMLDAAGVRVPWVGTVVADATITSGAGTIIVTGPAIQETDGQYNTVDVAPLNNDVVTLSVLTGVTVQPNLFWHKNAFGIGSVPLQKLFATDTVGETEDGLQIRVTKFSDGVKNVQKVRFDLLPAYAALNPFFAGQGFGSP
jgi:hypothetical protein